MSEDKKIEWVKPSKDNLPPPYEYVSVKDEGGAQWHSYVYPSGEWMFNKTPAFWCKIKRH